ncbi:hypothetical protein FOL47_000292 [Perkinsus chesapeaki]|uniref:Uncharacterized protein n=1 Tax=Perkinsus chesapeaki TaxID=330153 RepID=A0A7J6KYE8_PERCH|nr:hypothetical protein FOL47_000292 [Perkinsus chesapeaki]
MVIPHIDTVNRRFGRGQLALPKVAWNRVLSWSLYLRKQHQVMFMLEALKEESCELSNLRLLRIIGNYSDSADLRETPVPLLRAISGRCPKLAILEADIFCRQDVMSEVRLFIDGCHHLKQLDVLCYHDSVGPCTLVDILPREASHCKLSRIGLVGCMSHMIGINAGDILTRAMNYPNTLTHINLRGLVLKGRLDEICAVASLPRRLPNLVHWAVRVNMLCFPLNRIIEEREATPMMLWNVRLVGFESTCIDCEAIRPDKVGGKGVPWLNFLSYTKLADKASKDTLSALDAFRSEFGQFLSDISFTSRDEKLWEDICRTVKDALLAQLKKRSKVRRMAAVTLIDDGGAPSIGSLL